MMNLKFGRRHEDIPVQNGLGKVKLLQFESVGGQSDRAKFIKVHVSE
jgi:hypothetical protein